MTLITQIEPRLPQLKKGAIFIKDINPTLLTYYLKTSLETFFTEKEPQKDERYDLTTTKDGFIITDLLTNEDYLLIVNPATIILKPKNQKNILFYIQKQANSILTLINQETMTTRTTDIYKYTNKNSINSYSYFHQTNEDYPTGGTLTSLKTTLKAKNYYEYQNAYTQEKKGATIGITYHEEDKYPQIYTKLQEILLKEQQMLKRTKKPKAL